MIFCSMGMGMGTRTVGTGWGWGRALVPVQLSSVFPNVIFHHVSARCQRDIDIAFLSVRLFGIASKRLHLSSNFYYLMGP